MTFLQTVAADHAIQRLLEMSRRDVRRRALRQKPDARDHSQSSWTSLMIDRTALLLPRLQGAKNSYADVPDDTLHHLRIGHAIMQIAQARTGLQGETAAEIKKLLPEIARYFDGRHRCDRRQAFDLEDQIDKLMAENAEPADEMQALLIDHLIDLRFALGVGSRMEARRS